MKKRAHVARDPDMPGPRNISFIGDTVDASAKDKEELGRFHMQLQSKVDTQGELQSIFGHETTSREKERALARKLFKQAPAASTMAPILQPDVLTEPAVHEPEIGQGPMKLASAELVERRLSGSPAPRVDAFLEKNASAFMTEAQRRYPELLKVACTRSTPKRKTVVPTQAQLSGGSA
jgi:hypothetical protein